MKNLDLNAYGVEEMSVKEMENVDGGIGILAFLLIAAAVIGVIYLLGGEGDTSLEVSN